MDVATNAWKVSIKDTFSFYFSDFPETHGAREMLRAFSFYGEAMEVVIPSRRDRLGKRFGFVRFGNVEDPRLFAVKLDNIIFGAKKIHVNIPRFQRVWSGSYEQQWNRVQGAVGGGDKSRVMGGGREGERSRRWVQQKKVAQAGNGMDRQQQVKQIWRKKEGDVREGRRLEAQNPQNVQKIIYHRKNNSAEVCYNASEEDMKKYKNTLVGTVRTAGSTYTVQEWFNMQGFFSIKVTPLGANKVLMEETEDGVFSVLMNEYQEWLYEKFDDVRGWEPEVVDNERVVWVRCHGIPVHAWNNDFFASLARNFGEFLGVDEATRTKSAMDVARIRLRSNCYDVFNTVVTANINDSLFHIKLVEEWCGPLQWLENQCCKKQCSDGDTSDSDDSGGGEPPLFSAKDAWCGNYDEEGDEGSHEYIKESEKLKGFDEESFVQETIGIFEENMGHECAGNGNESVAINNNDDGKGMELNGNLKNGEELLGVNNNDDGERMECNGNLKSGLGGIAIHVNTMEHVPCSEKSGAHQSDYEVATSGGSSSLGGLEKQLSGLAVKSTEVLGLQGVHEENMGANVDGPARKKLVKHKKKKKLGLRIGKQSKEKRKNRKNSLFKRDYATKQATVSNARLLSDAPPVVSPASASPAALDNSSGGASVSMQDLEGVSRNPVGENGPTSSWSVSSNTMGSHVESIGDSGIVMGNNRFDVELERIKATKLWRMAKDNLGVSAPEEEDEMFIERLRAMEEKAKAEKSRKGKKKGVK